MQITTVGLDIAKNVFQVHGIDAAEKVVIRKQLRRGQVLKFFASLPPCLDDRFHETAHIEHPLWSDKSGCLQTGNMIRTLEAPD